MKCENNAIYTISANRNGQQYSKADRMERQRKNESEKNGQRKHRGIKPEERMVEPKLKSANEYKWKCESTDNIFGYNHNDNNRWNAKQNFRPPPK